MKNENLSVQIKDVSFRERNTLYSVTYAFLLLLLEVRPNGCPNSFPGRFKNMRY